MSDGCCRPVDETMVLLMAIAVTLVNGTGTVCIFMANRIPER